SYWRSIPNSTSVIDDLLGQQGLVETRELGMVDQHEDDVGRAHSLVQLGEGDIVPIFELVGQFADVGFDGHDARLGEFLCELTDYLASRALTQVIDIRFERQAEGSDPHVLDPTSLGEKLAENIPGFGIVDLACGPDQGGVLRCARDDEPRVDGDAVPADARPRL